MLSSFSSTLIGLFDFCNMKQDTFDTFEKIITHIGWSPLNVPFVVYLNEYNILCQSYTSPPTMSYIINAYVPYCKE
jgi:hypothetical protein